ncbi:TIR domain-containing protein [Tenacibaculum dicentrarchi]|nr:TIR domain-containing protein [Tenacibaculum dicentrarchi]MCD8425872.1 TIR domain-containing protein [Tenacibaculum dicentrarchi]MCD8442915.1 TIR domain-containing protein [Tenacibaculum dicentrarchi]
MAIKKNLFISHSWNYGETYDSLIKLLDERGYFPYNNYSVPKDDPIHNAPFDYQLYAAIKAKIAPSSCVLIIAGVYSSYSKWIEKEIKIAKTEFYSPKPIIAIEPWGSERTSRLVKNNADAVVKWQKDKIVEAIRDLT